MFSIHYLYLSLDRGCDSVIVTISLVPCLHHFQPTCQGISISSCTSDHSTISTFDDFIKILDSYIKAVASKPVEHYHPHQRESLENNFLSKPKFGLSVDKRHQFII